MAEWNILGGFPGEDPSEYQQLAELVPSLTHLQPPGAVGQIRLDRFSPYFDAPDANGLVNVRASVAYRHVYPFDAADLDRLAYFYDYEYADRREPERYLAPLMEAVDGWNAHHTSARLELRVDDDRLEIQDTRPAAVHATTILHGPARLAYLALDAGATVPAVQAELWRTLGEAAPGADEIERWLEEWLALRLMMREGPRYLSLATRPSERVRLPVNRFLAELAGTAP